MICTNSIDAGTQYYQIQSNIRSPVPNSRVIVVIIMVMRATDDDGDGKTSGDFQSVKERRRCERD